MTEHIQTIVIGAGIIGLATARALASSGREVIVLESEEGIGTITSSRNSEVIHAGIYYSKNSLKAKLCVSGNKSIYKYCTQNGVPFKRIGKLIVATNEHQIPLLAEIMKKAKNNGVKELEFLSKKKTKSLDPNLKVKGAIFSPSTGIVDSHSLMLTIQGDAENSGAIIAFRNPVEKISLLGDKFLTRIGGFNPMTITSNEIINCGGLNAIQIASSMIGLIKKFIPPRPDKFAKGNYFSFFGECPFKHLIYPIPVNGGLGIHSTIDLGGQTKFGPDIEWIDTLNYEVDPRCSKKFYNSIRQYWPELPDNSLQPSYSGIRPKIGNLSSDKYESDFIIQGEDEHGIKGLVNLFGIESPGLTSSLTIADYVLKILEH